MKYLILIVLFFILDVTIASAQDAQTNRMKIISMVLDQSRAKVNTDNYKHSANIYTITPAVSSAPECFRNVSTIPKYCLAKGAVICRLEEYVQLHSPFKLNIGVGGE